MTPKEKAKELVDKFLNIEKGMFIGHAKTMAYIAVEEVYNQVPSIYLTNDKEIHSGHNQYWKQVKLEIEAL